MRSHAKAPTAGSTKRQAKKPALMLFVLATAVAALALVVGSASAAKVHSFKEVFGSAAQPSFSTPRDIAVDPTSGDVYVMDAGGTPSISRYNADGTADNFSALGTNVIDGTGTGDETPQNGLGFASPSESQVAVDDSGGATDGNIYVTQSSPNAINVFASTGAYLGQLTAAGVTNFTEACGVAVDSAGAVYVGDYTSGIKKFVPAANPPVNADHTATFNSVSTPCTLAAGAGATAGFLFPAQYIGPIFKIDSGTGELKYTVSSGFHTTVSVDPTNGHVFGATESTVKEFDASGGSATSFASLQATSGVQGLASNGDIYVSRSGFSNVEVYASALTVFPDVTTNAATNNSGTKATLNGTVNPDGLELDECFFEWGPTTAYGNIAPCAESPAAIGSGTSPVAVHADITGLQPNGATYNFRLVAVNENATVNGSNLSFITADSVVTTAATGITPTTATLNGTVNPNGMAITECLFEWGETTAYGNTAPCVPNAAGIGSGTSPVAVSANLSGLEISTVYHYRLKAADANGAILGEDLTLQTAGPVIKATWAEDVVRTEAILKAEINPEGVPTTYHFEYGTTEAYGSETPELAVGSDSSFHEVGRFLEDLEPGTTYHYRVVATNVVAVKEGPDRVIRTHEIFVPKTDCPNQVFRVGASASLPDCRAYEMVSPLNKGGSDIVGVWDGADRRAAFDQAAPSGDKIIYGAALSFGDQAGSQLANEYLSSRGADGWTTHGINSKLPNGRLENVIGLSPDLSREWVRTTYPLTPDSMEGFYNLYGRDLSANSYETLTNNQPTSFGEAPELGLEFKGASADATRSVFQGYAALTPDAAAGPWRQIYELSEGELHLVSVLPDGTPYPQNATVGVHADIYHRADTVDRAVSADGSRVFWTAIGFGNSGGGTLYVRVNADQEQSALNGEECTEPAKACTILVSAAANFLTASVDGSEVVFSSSGDLYRFHVDTETLTPIAPEVRGIAGASEDLSNIYFVSSEVLDSGAVAGEWNLYLDYEGTKTFIATLASNDVGVSSGLSYSAIHPEPINRASRVTSDGGYLAFQSSVSLTGYDNVAANGEAAIEVYLYDADAQQLTCVSCNPSGARPRTRVLRRPYAPGLEGGFSTGLTAAAWLPTWEHQLNPSRPLSEDGGRLFFNSFDVLVPWDTNGKQDVYQWEAQGTGTCQQPGGCVSLISNGESSRDSEFVGASSEGDDVFIRTESAFDPRDPGLIDIYDARAGGGFPLPPPPPVCVGDACQNIPAGPNDPTPSSASFRGAGDLEPGRNCSAPAKRAAKLNRQARRARQQGLRHRAAQLAKRAQRLSRSASRCRRANREARR